jgi:hypothetical protein
MGDAAEAEAEERNPKLQLGTLAIRMCAWALEGRT